jgi:hypothetical protein
MSFQDIKIDNWIKNNQETYLANNITFETFTAELRKYFLDPHWELSIVRTIVNSQMTSQESFSTFANRVMQGNNLLIGTPSRLDSAALRAKLELNMSGYLADKLTRMRPTDKDRIAAINIFEDWLAEITLLDEEITADLKRIADFATEHIAKRQRTENNRNNMFNSTPIYPPPLSGSNAVTPTNRPNTYVPRGSSRGSFRASNMNTHRTGRRLRCPKLTPDEYDLLEKHNGCRKCRRFYVNHQVLDCPNDFPDPDNYVTLTEEMAMQAMASAAIASTYNGPQGSAAYNTPPNAFVEEIHNDTPSVQTSVAAILPSSTSSTPFNLGTGESDTESNSSTT